MQVFVVLSALGSAGQLVQLGLDRPGSEEYLIRIIHLVSIANLSLTVEAIREYPRSMGWLSVVEG
jgi:hypothetical protein